MSQYGVIKPQRTDFLWDKVSAQEGLMLYEMAQVFRNVLGPVSILRPSFPVIGIPMLKIRQSWDCLIFNMDMDMDSHETYP